MKHIPTFEDFVNESYNRTQTKYKTQNVDWDDIAPGDYIADGPNVGEVSRVISNTKKGFTLKRVWNNVRKKDGEEFFVPHDLDAMKDHPKSIIKVMDYVNESEDLDEGRKYTAKEKNKFFDYWDVLFTELGITDTKEQDAVVKAFDKLDGDDANGTLVEVISDALDKAKVGFNYKKLEDFYQKHIK